MSLKKIIAGILALSIVFISVPVQPFRDYSVGINYSVSAESDENDFEFEGGTLKKYTGSNEDISIPEMINDEYVTSIGEKAFEDCSSITSLTIPETVTRIENAAFKGCTSITELKIPDSVTEMGENVFEDCSSLVNVTTPCSLKNNSSILSLISVNKIAEESVTYNHSYTVDGICENCNSQLFDILETVDGIIIKGINDKCIKEVIIPERIGDKTVVAVEDEAFACSSLKKITAPCSLKNSQSSWNEECNADVNYNHVYRSDSEKCICEDENNRYVKGNCGDNANYNFDKATCTLTISGTGTIRSDAFSQYSPSSEREIRESIKIVAISEGITAIENNAFENCTKLTSVTIPASVERIDFGAFENSRLNTITFAEGCKINKIAYNTFKDCSNLETITIPASVENIEYSTFENSGLKTITFEEGCMISTIAYNTFKGCSNLETITIPASVASIANNAFNGCKALETITIPASVESIEYSAFENSGLKTITFEDGCMISKIDIETFKGCSTLKNITIPASVTIIDNEAFNGCSALEAITIPASVERIEYSAFENSGLKTITFAEGCKLSTIANKTFKGCSNLKNITIPASVENIERSAFENSGLNTISFSDNSKLSAVGKNAFCGTEWLSAQRNNNPLVIVNGILIDGNTCSGDVAIPNSVKSICVHAFYQNDLITSVYIPDSVENMPDFAIASCTSITSIKAPCRFKSNESWWNNGSTGEVTYTHVFDNNSDTCVCGRHNSSHNYNAYGYCSDCGNIRNGMDAFTGAYASVTGRISMVFKTALSDEAFNAGAKVVFSLESGKKFTVPVTEEMKKNGIYEVPLVLNATQMDENITAKVEYTSPVTYSDGTSGSVVTDYSVNKYLNNINPKNNSALSNIINAMLNFGAYTDIYVGDTTPDVTPDDSALILTDEEKADLSANTAAVSSAGTGVTAKSAFLTVGSLVDITVKFTLSSEKNVSDYEFTIDGNSVSPVHLNGDNENVYSVTVSGISPLNYDKKYIFNATEINNTENSATVQYNVLTYINNKLNAASDSNNNVDPKLVDICKAMYKYGKAAKAYSAS